MENNAKTTFPFSQTLGVQKHNKKIHLTNYKVLNFL
jgi:hypothetical protein